MRRRVLLAIVSATALAVALFGIPLAVVVRNLYRTQVVLRLEREAANAAASILTPGGGAGDLTELPTGGPARLAVYAPDGTRRAGEGPGRADITVRQAAAEATVQDGQVGRLHVVAYPVVVDETVVAVVRAVERTDEANVRTLLAWGLMALLGSGVIVASAALASWQARGVTRPLVGLGVAATRLGQGDFSARAEHSGLPEIDRVVTALGSTADRLDDLIARERSFSADASHQLRTHVTGLRLLLEEAAAATPSPALSGAADVVDRLESTIDDLLALAGHHRPAASLLQVDQVLGELRDAWAARFSSEDRLMVVELRPDAPPASARAAAVRQVLAVLVANAFEHGDGQVVVCAHDAGTGLAIDVSDEGPGPAEPAEQLFRRGDLGRPGRGMGLALARRLARAEQGELLLHRSGPAPCFRLLLPPQRNPAEP